MTREMDITACHKDYMKYLPRWTRIKTVMEGADAVKAAGESPPSQASRAEPREL